MYFCFDHGVEYGEDGFMCPACEREICETHDQPPPKHGAFNAQRQADEDTDMRMPEEIFQHYTDRIRQSTNKNRGMLIDPFGNILWEESRDAWQKRLREMPDPYNILCATCNGFGCKGSLRTSCLSYGRNEYGEFRPMIAGSGQEGYNQACAPQMPITP